MMLELATIKDPPEAANDPDGEAECLRADRLCQELS